MAKRIPHRELRNNSSGILREVQSGESFEITNNGKVVALLIPPPRVAGREVPVRPVSNLEPFGSITTYPGTEPTQVTMDELRGDE